MSSKVFQASILYTLLLTLPLAAQPKDYSTPIARKAVEAVGDIAKQRELQGFTCETESTFMVDDNAQVKMSGMWTISGFDNFRGDLTPTVNGNPISLVFVLSGKQGWLRDANRGKTNKIPEEVLPVVLADFHAIRLAQQPHILLHERTELSNLGQFVIEKEDAVGLKVKLKDLPDFDLFLSKKTGLPMKVSVRVLEPGGAEMEHVFVFKDWKQTNGLNHFTKLEFHRDNKQIFDMQLTNINIQKDVEKSLFAEP